VLSSPGLRAAAAVLSVASLGLGAAWLQGSLPPLPLVIALSAQAGFALSLRSRVRRVVQAVEAPARDLSLLAGLLARIEAERFGARRLVELQQVFAAGGAPASRRVAQLQRYVDLLDARRNQLFAPIGALLCWSTQLAFAIEAWRLQHGSSLRRWIGALGEVEALVSLAGYAYERPLDVFPELLEAGPPRFEADGLGHPLLPVDRCVRNDVALTPALRLLVVSGSNMSGKSTLLRAVGANAVLAQAGAPVCARRLRLSPVQVGASVQLRDSLLAGQSRFYAEIQRLRLVYELAGGDRPVVFLLDEILHGTNAQERRTGAEAVIRGLLGRGAVGIVTTHDLALADIVKRQEHGAANVHFPDHVDGGELRFDYRLHPGVAQHGNALALMRALGLPV
jgi:DNA mismatch repair ATPase MutS